MKELSADALNKPRKRRLRKKLRVGEFQEFGFQVEFDLGSDTHMPFDDALDEWIDFVESQEWAFGGGGNIEGRKIEGFVAKAGRGTLKEEDRLLAKKWFREKEWVEGFQVASLKDAWHGW